MSEQNSMAISPVTAGLTGAAIGGFGNYFMGVGAKPEKGYQDVKELLTLENDKFEALKKKIEDSDNADAKAEFKKLEDGRTTVSSAGDALVKEQADAKKKMSADIEQAVKDGKITAADTTAETNELNTAKTELTEAKKPLTEALADTADGKLGDLKAKAKSELAEAVKQDKIDALKADESKQSQELKDLIAKEKAETDAAKKAELGKKVDAQAKKDIIAGLKNDENSALRKYQAEVKKVNTDDVKTAVKGKAEAVQTKKTAVFNKQVSEAEKAIGENPTDDTLKALKKTIADTKALLEKKVDDIKKAEVDKLVGDNGTLKDLDMGKFKKFLPKAKMIPALIGAAVLGAAGVALAYIVGPKNETPADVA